MSWVYSDAENDNIVANYTFWYVNDVNVYNGTETLDAANFSIGDTVICGVVIEDTTENSTQTNSSTLTINDSNSPTVKIFSHPSLVVTNNPMTFTINITDTGSDIEFVKILIDDPNEYLVTRTASFSSGTNSPGQYSIWTNIYTPIITGTYNITGVNYSDTSGNYYFNTSFSETFDVTASGGGGGGGGGAPPTVECNLDSDCITKFGDGYNCVSHKCILNVSTISEEQICNYNGICEPEKGEDIFNCGNRKMNLNGTLVDVEGDCQFSFSGFLCEDPSQPQACVLNLIKNAGLLEITFILIIITSVILLRKKPS